MTISLACKGSVEAAISEHMSQVQLDGEYKCEKCSRESKASVSHEFVRLPRYFLLHIKRFDDQFTKIDNRISYPALLDINQLK